MTDSRTYQLLKAAGEKRHDFSLFGEFTKAEEQDDGTLIVSGIASSESMDSDGEIIRADAIKKAIPDYMKWGAVREMHSNIAAGSALSIRVNDDGQTEFEAHVVDDGSIKKVKAGVLKGFSVGGKKLEYDPTNRRVITGIKLSEISLVDRPANPDCRFEIAKFDGGSMDESEAPTAPTGVTATSAAPLVKSLYDVGSMAAMLQSIGWMIDGLQRESEVEGDESTIPQKLREWLSLGCEIFESLAEEEIQELLADVAGPGGMPLKGGDEKAEKVAQREDTNPKEGKKKYGNVAFADDKNKKYPIDTEAHIRAAWNYINKEKNATNYSPEDVKKIKAKIIAAWKKVIDKDGPPSAGTTKEKADMTDELNKAHKDAADALKAYKDLEEAHKAHKDAAAAVHGLKEDASKEDVAKAFRDLAAAHKGMKDAADAHMDECAKMKKAVLGSIKDSAKDDDEEDSDKSEKFEKLSKTVEDLSSVVEDLMKRLKNTPAASPLELAILTEKGVHPLNKKEDEEKPIDPKTVSIEELAKAALRNGRPY